MLTQLTAPFAEHFAATGATELTQNTVLDHVHRFARFADAHNINNPHDVTQQLVEDYINARLPDGTRPVVATRHHRRSAIRSFYRFLISIDPSTPDPTALIRLPSRTEREIRPFTDSEMDRVREASRHTLKSTNRAAIVAVAEAGGTAYETAVLSPDDIDLEAGLVQLAGTRNLRPRTRPLTSWGLIQVRRHLATLDDHTNRFVYRGASPRNSGAASIDIQIRRIFDRALLHDDPLIGVRSIRFWAGRRVYERTRRVEDAAVFLGYDSLDRTAQRIGLRWQPDEPL